MCADSGLQHTAVVAGDTSPTRVISNNDSLQIAFDAQTKLMVCQSEMFTMNGDFQDTRDATWMAQPTADGFNISVDVDMSRFYSAAQAPFYGG